jgi:hypothetical protein
MQNDVAKQIVQANDQLAKMVNTQFSWRNEGLPKGILAMRKKVAQGNKEFAETGWADMCEAFVSPRLRKRALTYMCLDATISTSDAIAVVQYEVFREHIKGEEVVPATA